MLKVFCSPSRYVQGPGASAELGAQLQAVGLRGPALIVGSERTVSALSPGWQKGLEAAGIEYRVELFNGECTDVEIDRLTVAATKAQVTVVVGVGGGKALDTARAVAANCGADAVNCPTLASSDAPCSALSVVYDAEGSVDRYIFYPRNPALVLVDTSVIANAPRRHFVSGMGDALATYYEARTVTAARKPNQVHGLTTLTAMAIAELCRDTLLRDGVIAADAIDVDAATPAVERVVEANTLLSGLGFESGGLAIAHSVHNGLSELAATHDYMHGEKVSFGLIVQLVVEGQPTHELNEVLAFCQAVGLPTRLRDIGLADLSHDDIAVIAKRTVMQGETAHNEPFPVTETIIADGIRAADAYASTFGD